MSLISEALNFFKKMSTIKFTDARPLLNDDQFYSEKQVKQRICLHHTAGGTARSSISWWNQKPDRVSTPYVIDRNGEILETFNPDCWAYALGINSSSAEKKTIHIEIASRGWLSEKNGKFYYDVNGKLHEFNGEVVRYKQPHRGYKIYEKYTDEQVVATMQLIKYLDEKFKLGIKGSGSAVKEFWHYDFNSMKKIISHTTVRKDKSDIHPQPNLIKAIYDYAGYTGPVTE